MCTEIESRGVSATAIQLDCGDTSQFDAARTELAGALESKWGRTSFDFLVNNAGHGLHASFLETTEADFDRLVDVHLKGVFFLTQKMVPLLEDGGRILNISTGLTRFALPGYGAYASVKGGVEVLTRYLAKELGSRGISVNTIAPGAIETDMQARYVREGPALSA